MADKDKDHDKTDKSKQDLKKSSPTKDSKKQSAKPKSRKSSPDWVSTKSKGKQQHSNKSANDTKKTKKDESIANKCYSMANSLFDNAKAFFMGKEAAKHEGTVKKSPVGPKKSLSKKSSGAKSPASKSPASKRSVSKSPASKSPASKSPGSKSPGSKPPASKSPSKSTPSLDSGRKHSKSPDGRHSKRTTSHKKKHRRHSCNDDIFEINVTQFKQANKVAKQQIAPLPQMIPTGKWAQCDGPKRKNSKDGRHDEHNKTADKSKQKSRASSINQKGSKSKTSLSPGNKSAGTAKKPKTKSSDQTGKPTEKVKSGDKLKPKSKTVISPSKAQVVHKKTDAKAHEAKPKTVSPDSKNKKSPGGKEPNDTKKKKSN